jgi:RNA polymerase sigma factor (sigma-70 family)
VNEFSDQDLLRDYAERQSEPAFAELVRRHIDFVYSAALRMVCDPHTAEDVTQNTFIALTKNALQVRNRSVLSSWLHSTARNLAANAVRTEVRRRAREQEAAAMNQLLANEPEAVWKNIAPHLDDAIAALGDADRDALLLRYFERKSAREMGQIFGTSEEAAQKRVSRAVERLREFFSKRGIAIGAGGLVILISANGVHAAPITLTASVSAAVLTGTTAANTSAAITATKAIVMTTLQKTLVTLTIVVLAGASLYEGRQTSQLSGQIRTLQQQQAPLIAQNQQLQHERDDAVNRLSAVAGENEQLKSNQNTAELLTLRGEVTQFKTSEADPLNVKAKEWLTKINKLKQRLEESPGAKVPELQYLTDNDWLNAASGKLQTDADYRQALGRLRSAVENHLAGKIHDALVKYSEANNDQFPTDLAQLQSYFDPPIDPDMLDRWQILPFKNSGLGGDFQITQKSTPDEMFDSRYTIGVRGYGSTSDFFSLQEKILNPVYDAYMAANNGHRPLDHAPLLPYATTPEQQTLIQKLATRDNLEKELSSH